MFALLICFSLLFNFQLADKDTTELPSEIESVTVFQNQAQIQRKIESSFQSGTTVIVFTGLSETLLDRSLQLKGNAPFTLLSLTTRFDFTEQAVSQPELERLKAQQMELLTQISLEQAELEVIQNEISMLGSTQDIIRNNKLSTEEINSLLTLYRTKLSELYQKRISQNQELTYLRADLEKVYQQINDLGRVERDRFKEVVAEVQLDSPAEMEFTLEYQVSEAGWIPSYDVRSEDINSPLSITYKAKIFQNTGVDWNNIKFTINSGDPTSNATKPELQTNYVGFYSPSRNARSAIMPSNVTSRRTSEVGIIRGIIKDDQTGEALPGVTVFVEGLGSGTATDLEGFFQIPQVRNGNHSLRVSSIGYAPVRIPVQISNNGRYLEIPLEQDVANLDEVVVVAEGQLSGVVNSIKMRGDRSLPAPKEFEPQIIQNQEVSNQTSFSYEIAIPYSVPSDGKYHTVDIKKESPESDYTYSTAPKLSEFAYLVGSLPDWNDLNLIEGEANIYFENRFIGTTFLNPVSSSDTLDISLGKDEQIVVQREQLKEFSSKNFFRNRTRENIQFEISVRNSKSQPITIKVEDQIPISTNEEIKVSVKELSDGKLNDETGIISWNLTINPGETKRVRFGFELEYPKGRRIVY
ncbi:MAG: mucoidy inhibitor MuiA family protein [Balneolaceae bacterium]|nr:mucoidy inhibitor MuiA family protein [Balneolaceae bacterium]MBO6546565.1 mucoidy inhibitor MuiA family protein [Balneolaceae bacterium]MBO6648924.1 mucoidy inhibitor MuiA family protein [Balneolaceae bacterium]